MRPQDVQIPKGLKLLCTVADYCRIMDFREDEDIENLGGEYQVRYRIATWHGKPVDTRRVFASKTFADRFHDLLRECSGVVILSDSEFKARIIIPGQEGTRYVNAYGSIEEQPRGVALGND